MVQFASYCCGDAREIPRSSLKNGCARDDAAKNADGRNPNCTTTGFRPALTACLRWTASQAAEKLDWGHNTMPVEFRLQIEISRLAEDLSMKPNSAPSFLTGERIFILHRSKGLAGARVHLGKLRSPGVL